MVSHDRVFLDEVSSDTLHVSGAARKPKLALPGGATAHWPLEYRSTA